MRTARSIPLLLALLLAGACSDDNPAAAQDRGELANSVDVGETFRLAPGHRARIGDDGLVVAFLGVREDSRCATDVQCVWAGDGAVALSVAIGRAEARTITLHTTVEPREVGVDGFVVRLVGLAPEPVSTRRIAPDDYVATLVVERRAAD